MSFTLILVIILEVKRSDLLIILNIAWWLGKIFYIFRRSGFLFFFLDILSILWCIIAIALFFILWKSAIRIIRFMLF